MVQPGNYSVHYMEAMDALAATCPPKWNANLRWLNGHIDRGEHFRLPDDGTLLDVRDMPDDMPRLIRPPFPVTVIEYEANSDCDRSDPLSYMASSKRIVVAIDDCGDVPPFGLLLSHERDVPPTNGVWLVPIHYNDDRREWTPPPAMFFIPYDGEVAPRVSLFPEQAEKMGMGLSELHRGMPMSVAGLAYEIFKLQTPHVTNAKEAEHFLGCVAADAQAELYAYLQLCITLGCSNVTASRTPAPAKLNKARRKAGKRPTFDYHVLTIPGSGSSGGTSGGDGRTVRTHLRRGHIRRAHGKLIWINATIVKGNAAGFVKKAYEVKAA